jgi:hypothetical protein
MMFKDGKGKTLEAGQKCVYVDQGLMDCEILEVENVSVLDGAGQRHPRVAVKLYLNFPMADPRVQMILVGNLRVCEDAPATQSKLSTVGDLTKH